jgi:hypothetical protein
MWFDIIKALQRIALSKNDKITKENKRQKEGMKPTGLWYSFSLGSGWMRRNMVDYGWLRSYKYILYLDTSQSNILQIKNFEDAKDFYEKFGLKVGPYRVVIKWDIVAYTYDGIELLNYKSWVKPIYSVSRDEEAIMDMFYGWDMDSGCIWNTQNLKVKKVKPIEQRHYDKEDKEKNRWGTM